MFNKRKVDFSNFHYFGNIGTTTGTSTQTMLIEMVAVKEASTQTRTEIESTENATTTSSTQTMLTEMAAVKDASTQTSTEIESTENVTTTATEIVAAEEASAQMEPNEFPSLEGDTTGTESSPAPIAAHTGKFTIKK